MEVGLIGLPFVGKTTLFAALTGVRSDNPGGRAAMGVAPIPDDRLQKIAQCIPPEKITPATLQVVDIAGLAPGGGQSGKILDHIRQVDAVCHVVPCFDDGSGTPRDPNRDIDAVDTELLLADLQVVENALPRAERSARSRDPKAVVRLALLKKLLPALEEGKPVRALIADETIGEEAELAALRELGLITAKKVVYVANVGEDDIGGEDELAQRVSAHAQSQGMRAVAVCTKLEAELAELSDEEQREMLEGLGIKEPALPMLASALHGLLGLQCFYTAGPKEVRAWTIPSGAGALKAAGTIHSDIERGFIRAEIYSVAELVEYKSEKAIREAGKMRVEGKTYTMQDGDVCHFLFNV